LRLIFALLAGLTIVFTLFTGVYSFDRSYKIHRHVDVIDLYLQWFDQAQFAGFYVATSKGFYDDANLEVRIKARPREGKEEWNVPKKISDSTDRDNQPKAIGVWTGDQVLRQYVKDDLQIAAVGTVFNRSLACFMVLDDSGIFSPKDFGGKRVGVYKGYDTEIIYNWLTERYPPSSPVTVEFVDPSWNYLEMLRAHAIDVWPSYAINEPLLAASADLKVRLIYPDYYDLPYYSDTIIVNRSTLTNQPNMISRFLEASERGWRYALENQGEAVQIIINADRKNLAPIEKQQKEMLAKLAFYVSTTNPIFEMNDLTWKSMAAILKAQNLVTNDKTYSGLIDLRIARDAHQRFHEEGRAAYHGD
jgi:NitT/TauT family transport system substrate-binding protein